MIASCIYWTYQEDHGCFIPIPYTYSWSASFIKTVIVKKALIIVAALIGGTILLRGPIYRCLFSYEVIGQRPIQEIPRLPSNSTTALDAGIDRSLGTVSHLLHFSSGNVSNDPRKLSEGGPANCIGYAALFAQLLSTQLDPRTHKISHGIARIHFLHLDIHSFTNDPFWKDHDIVIVEDLVNGRRIGVDPTLYDAVGISLISLKD